MKRHLAISISKGFLNFLLFVFGILLFVGMTVTLKYGITMQVCHQTIPAAIYLCIIYNLRKIVYSTDSTPFCLDNVKRFKRIGYCMFSVAVLYAIVTYKGPNYSGIYLFYTEYGSIKPDCIIYIILACVALVLSVIFEKAVEIKDENDLTI